MAEKSIFQKYIKCTVCGKKFWDFDHSGKGDLAKGLRNNQICMQCAQWKEICKKPPDDLEIINGIAYHFKPMSEGGIGVILGGNGEHRYIIKADNTIKESNDIWQIGKVPDNFRDKFPDTAWWMSERYAKKMLKCNFVCRGKLCLDRYRCLRYDIQNEYETGPANQIPLSWHIGDEKCRYFVDILSIRDYYNLFNPQDVIFYEKKN